MLVDCWCFACSFFAPPPKEEVIHINDGLFDLFILLLCEKEEEKKTN